MKNKAKLINVKIPEYWVETTEDYSKFKYRAIYLNSIGLKVKYKEIGCYRSKSEDPQMRCYRYHNRYSAVFWIGKRPTKFIEENKIKD